MTTEYTKYPYQIKKIIHRKENDARQVFSVEFKLGVATGESVGGRTPVPPLETPGYSVFNFVLIDENRNTYIANIPEDDINRLYLFTNKLIDIPMIKDEGMLSSSSLSKVYTYAFPLGKLKNRTAADILLNDPNGEQILTDQVEFLNKNISKYKSNAEQVSIINEALDLYHSGLLNKDQIKKGEIYQLLEPELKYKSPDARGYYTVYTVEIVKNTARNLCYGVTIMNCKAPLKKNKIGQETPDMSIAEDKRTFTLWMSQNEWIDVISKMHETKIGYRNAVIPQQIVKAGIINKTNIENSKM